MNMYILLQAMIAQFRQLVHRKALAVLQYVNDHEATRDFPMTAEAVKRMRKVGSLCFLGVSKCM
jgi:hypothetical protein